MLALLLIILSCNHNVAASRQTNLFGVQSANARSLIGVSPVSSGSPIGGYGYSGYGFGYGGYGAVFSEPAIPPTFAVAPALAPAPGMGPDMALLPQPAPGLPAPMI